MKQFKAKYREKMQKPDRYGFYDDGFEKVPGINAPQLKDNISIQN